MTEELDLTPREFSKDVTGSGIRSIKNWVISASLISAFGFIMFQAISSARVFFLNVDEAIAKQSDLGEQEFRMQGLVLTEAETETGYVFVVGFGGEQALVNHVGDEPTDIFECGQNVVIEGHWVNSEYFESQQILVKHSEEYREEYPDRTDTKSSSCINDSEINSDILELSGEI